MNEVKRVFRQYLIVLVVICTIFVAWTLVDVTTVAFETDPLSEVVDPKIFNPNSIRAPLTPSPPVVTVRTR